MSSYGTAWWWYFPEMKWVSVKCFEKLLLFPDCIVVGVVIGSFEVCFVFKSSIIPLMEDGNFLSARQLCFPDLVFVCVLQFGVTGLSPEWQKWPLELSHGVSFVYMWLMYLGVAGLPAVYISRTYETKPECFRERKASIAVQYCMFISDQINTFSLSL